MPEQEAFHLGKRQDTFDPAAGLGVEEISAVPKCPLDDGLPARAVEEGGFTATGHELVPAGKIGWLQFADADCFRRRHLGRSASVHRFNRELAHRSIPGTDGLPGPNKNP